ncbi:glycosyl transferases group 1 [Lucifera butyrica]|uniref:Glycosyl transferases group 1 n=1 Tax=Lucifera butyrica TaxID=1351585 RepID=A0A498R3X2_9FIRM|nr:glycosyltransferase [Lucifera butyrica]VBB05510.1 glycosyl transferases group 1 [Lucifera butyrica]
MRVILLKGQSQYGVLRAFIDQIADALGELGIEASIVDLAEDAEGIRNLVKKFSREVDFVFSFNLVGAALMIQQELFFNIMKVPFVSVLVDHPVHHWERLHCGLQSMLLGAVDKGGIEFINTFVPEIKNLYFLPQGAIVSPDPVRILKPAERKIQVFMPGTYYSVNDVYAEIKAIPSEDARNLLDAIIDQVLSEAGLSITAAAESVLRSNQIYSFELLKQLLPLFGIADRFIRACRRETAMIRLIQQNVKVTVCSHGWKRAKYAEHLDIYPEQPVLELIQLTRQAKVCVDVGVSYTYGGHERSLTSMLNYTPVVVQRAGFYEDCFEEGKHLLLFSYTNADELAEKVSLLLETPELQTTLAREGHDKVVKEHTWLNRAQTIVEQYKRWRDNQ